MPTYVYECSACSAIFEAEQRITADPLDECVPCGAKGTVKRVIQRVGIAFKGSGFHINDYSAKPTGAESKIADEQSSSPAATSPPPAPTTEPAKSESPLTQGEVGG